MLACKPVGHHRTVGVTGHVDTVLIDGRVHGQVVEHGQQEATVVDRVVTRPATAVVAGIPGQQVSTEGTGAIRIHGKEPFPVRHGIEGILVLELPAAPAPAVQGQHDRQTLLARVRRDMYVVAALQAVVLQGEGVVARREGPRTCHCLP